MLPSLVAKAIQILRVMPSIMKVSPIGAMEGWLRLELIEPGPGNAEVGYQINNGILSALIRAKIPILSFEVEGGRLQDVFMHLTEEAIV